ncbi:MAG: hypothetical protein ACOY94_22265 [Bacillota bacterium]
MEQRRSLALPHRAMRTTRVNRFHAGVGVLALGGVVATALTWYDAVWVWQMAAWSQFAARFGIYPSVRGYGYGWDQTFSLASLTDLLLTSVMLLLVSYLLFRSTVTPTIKGLFAITAVPLYLYMVVTYITGAPPVGALNHVGPEWLYGEVVVWCLVPLLYAVLVFPIPFSLPVKLFSLIAVLGTSVAWRTFTPALYILISVYSKGTLSLPAWMILGPWADYLYVIPVFAVTLSFYRGGSANDYRS